MYITRCYRDGADQAWWVSVVDGYGDIRAEEHGRSLQEVLAAVEAALEADDA